MRRRAAVFLACASACLCGSLFAGSLNRDLLRTPSGLTAAMLYRSLQPGEPVLFLAENGGEPQCTADWLGHSVRLRPEGKTGRALAFIGIDLGTRPGTYPLTLRFRKADGTVEAAHWQLIVAAKDFPSEKLWLKPEMVTPPASLMETIKREAEIVSWAYARRTPAWLGDGPFVVPNPAQAFPNFGQRRIVNNIQQSVHGGIDLMAPLGDPVKAGNSGEVALAANLYFSGNTIILDHGLGVFSFYCHLSKLLVRHGMAVKKGDVLGLCGSTGRSTGPHLHWAMKILDARVDPEAMLLFPLGGEGSQPGGKGEGAAGK